MNYRIGVDLGGTNIAAGIVTDTYEILERASVPTRRERSADEIITDIAALVHALAEKQGLPMEEIASIGIGVPGTANKETGCIEFANNLAFENVAFVSILQEKLHKRIYFDNDANAAAYGEYLAGAGKGSNCESLVIMTLGTGIGGGLILNGEIYQGTNFGAGEIGHMVIDCGGIKCNCGRCGCLETYASATALIGQAREKMLKCRDSLLWELCGGKSEKIDGRMIFEAVRAKDKTAQCILETYLSYLSAGVVNTINMLQPDILCIGGGISAAGELILNTLKAVVEQEAYTRGAKKQTRLCMAERGNDAGIIGAAFLKR